MSDRDALLTAILADPDEDTPRLVYADWLQEHGEAERAEFIRLQCELARLPPQSERATQLALRASALRDELFARLEQLPFADLRFARGFVAHVASGCLNFLDHAAALGDDAPAYGLALALDERDNETVGDDYDAEAETLGRVGNRPELARCVALDLPCLGIGNAANLLRSPHLTALRRLNFPDNEAGPVVELVASPTYANLRWANFHNSDSASDCPSIEPFAVCPHLANLEYLDFGECEQGDPDLLALATTPHLPRLRYLDISTSQFGPDAVGEFFHSASLPALTELNLSYTFGEFTRDRGDRGDAYLARIAAAPRTARVTKLWLWGNAVTDAGARALAASPLDLRLRYLDLTGNPIGEEGRRALRDRFGPDVCAFEERSG
jgi:uncharacterized protein (TIGR02996 family)